LVDFVCQEKGDERYWNQKEIHCGEKKKRERKGLIFLKGLGRI
jgi:hypothetical protein